MDTYGHTLTSHRAAAVSAGRLRTIVIRRSHRTAAEALGDASFLASLYETLTAWGIGQRASRLVDFEKFEHVMQARLRDISAFEDVALGDQNAEPRDTAERLWHLIDELGIVENEATIVAGTKALHHVLPDLVVPMDRAYTGLFFGWHPPEFQNGKRLLRSAFPQFARVAREIDLGSFVGSSDSWHTSKSKVIDNALIGYCQMIKAVGRETQRHSI